MPDLIMFQPILNLSAALLFGAIIGMERQWRQRLAGLRTNTLVALTKQLAAAGNTPSFCYEAGPCG